MHLKWSKYRLVMINSWLIILVMSIEFVRCSSTSSSSSSPTLTKSTITTTMKSDRRNDGGDLKSHLIKTSVRLLKNHLFDRAIEPRATTSSQVIEYNARNIVLMTLLNSFLILGGILGGLNRPELGGLPFKRKDPTHLHHNPVSPLKKKKWFWNKSPLPDQNQNPPPPPLPEVNFGQPNHNQHNHHQNELAAMQTLMSNMLNLESLKDLQDSSTTTRLPQTSSSSRKHVITNNDLMLGNNIDTTTTNRNNNNYEYVQDIFPRMFAQTSVRRRNDHASDLAPKPNLNLNLGENCALLIHCTDANGKPYYPSLSMLTKTALQLVNENLVETTETTVKQQDVRRKPRSVLLNTVKEMVEIEQKNNSCQWKQLCQV